ncbi:MAG: hypothetical protein RR942_06505 [Romboutsia sp.]
MEITNDMMFADYDLWLYDNGYIENNEYAEAEYELWKTLNGYID